MRHPPARRIDPNDHIARPDVGINGALRAFELVQMIERLPVQRHGNGPHDAEVGGTTDREAGRAVTHEERVAVAAQPPALAAIGQLTLFREGRTVVYQRALVLPGELN